MATIYPAPEGFDPPNITNEDYAERRWETIEAAYIERLATRARLLDPLKSLLVGRIIRFPWADGYAQYMVWRTRPLQLIHLELGDAWSIPDAHARGLRLTDVREIVEREDRLTALFAK